MKITRKKPSLFLILYLSITAFFALLLVIGGFVLNRWLYAFEKSEAIHPAEDAFEEYFAAYMKQESMVNNYDEQRTET